MSETTDKLPLETEKEWVEKAQGDLAHFTPLYEHYLPKIYRYLSFKTNNPGIAEDLSAQTFCEALENLRKFKWQGNSFGAWLYRIAHNLLVDHYKEKGTDLLNENDDYESSENVADEVNQNWSLSKIYDALRTLPEMYQQVVTLRVSEDLSHKEIGDILGKSENNIKVIYSRAIQQLKEKIVFVLALLLYALFQK